MGAARLPPSGHRKSSLAFHCCHPSPADHRGVRGSKGKERLRQTPDRKLAPSHGGPSCPESAGTQRAAGCSPRWPHQLMPGHGRQPGASPWGVQPPSSAVRGQGRWQPKRVKSSYFTFSLSFSALDFKGKNAQSASHISRKGTDRGEQTGTGAIQTRPGPQRTAAQRLAPLPTRRG